MQVVVYDDQTGAYAARLWWMLRWLGHEAAAVLDGGWQAWQERDLPVREGEEHNPRRVFSAHPRPELIASASEVDAMRLDPSYRILDARSADRYAGRNENRDPVAGHIPGAVSAPYADNLESRQGIFKDQARAAPALPGDPGGYLRGAGGGLLRVGGNGGARRAGDPARRFRRSAPVSRLVERMDHRSRATGRVGSHAP